MIRELAPILAASLIAAPVAARQAGAHDYSLRMMKLTDLQRRGAIRGAIVESGEKCPRIGAVAYQGPWKNLDMWVARCGPHLRYGVFVGPDGTAQVSNCDELVKLKVAVCRKVD